MTRVLFLLRGKYLPSSPMAEGIFNDMVRRRGETRIARPRAHGPYAIQGDAVTTNAVAACLEIGVDIAAHTARPFDARLMDGDCVAVPLTHAYADALLGAGAPRDKLYIPRESVSDPFGGDLECYRHCRDQLEALCQELLEGLIEREQRH